MIATAGKAARERWAIGVARYGLTCRRWLLRALPVVVVWAGLWLCVTHAWVPFGQRFGVTIPDDAFYYFSTAWHAARGEVPSVDGFSPTNGFHPLWFAMIVPIFYFFRASPDLETPISWVLTVGATLHVVAGVLLWRITRRLDFSYGARLVALAYYCGNAYQVANAINGLESALAVAAVLAAYLAFLCGREDPSDRRMPWLFGLACGAAILARTDHLLLVGVLLLAILWPARQVSWACAGRWFLATAGMSAALFLPWAIFSYATVGTVIQSSGLALPITIGRMPEVWGLASNPGLRVEQALAAIAEAYGLVARFVNLGAMGLPALLLLTGSAAAAAALKPGWATRYRRQYALILPLVVGLLALFFVHTCVRLSFREWYTVSMGALAALLIGLVVDWAARRLGSQLAATAAILLLAWPLYSGYRAWQTSGVWSPPRDERGPSGPGPRPHVAHSDCGVAAYYATYGVTNLDGIVNQQAFEALRERRLFGYIASQHFTSFALTPHLQSAAFMGRGYRESVISLNQHELRVVSAPSAKDARLMPGPKPFPLGTLDGRDLLSDGWIWPQEPASQVQSIGPWSELVFYLPSIPSGGEAVLKARALVMDDTGKQPTQIFLNGERVGAVAIGSDWQDVAIPLATARAGRNRLRLEYSAPRAIREKGADWYRSLWGNPVSAIAASTLSLKLTRAGPSAP